MLFERPRISLVCISLVPLGPYTSANLPTPLAAISYFHLYIPSGSARSTMRPTRSYLISVIEPFASFCHLSSPVVKLRYSQCPMSGSFIDSLRPRTSYDIVLLL